MYDIKKDGFAIIPGFFSSAELAEMEGLAKLKMASKNSRNAYRNFSVAQYDVVSSADLPTCAPLRRLAGTVDELVGQDLDLYNSLFVELRGEDIETKGGFDWHQDLASFAVLEKGTEAYFTWFIFENTFSDGGGTLEIATRESMNSLLGSDLSERNVSLYDTEFYFKKTGIDLRHKGKFVALDVVTNRIINFFDKPLSEGCIKPLIKPGDLVVCRKDIPHRTAPTNDLNGHRSAMTVRFVEKNATYNGILDEGIPSHLYSVYENSELWKRLKREGKGAKVKP